MGAFIDSASPAEDWCDRAAVNPGAVIEIVLLSVIVFEVCAEFGAQHSTAGAMNAEETNKAESLRLSRLCGLIGFI